MSTIYELHVLEHAKNTSHFGTLAHATHVGNAQNVSCGDTAELRIVVQNDIVTEALFNAHGCALSHASESMFIEFILGKKVDDIKNIIPSDIYSMLGVHISPARTPCALMCLSAWTDLVQKYDA